MREHAISLSSGTAEDNMLSVRRAELPFAVASKAPERRRPRSWAPQQKTEKISSILRTSERKGWTVSQRRDNPDPGAGIICRLSNRRRHDKVSWVLPRRWRDYSALLACHEQTTHLGPRPEKAAVARETA